jgi:hypothetical protein
LPLLLEDQYTADNDQVTLPKKLGILASLLPARGQHNPVEHFEKRHLNNVERAEHGKNRPTTKAH